ncbi:hypothetical protein HK405_003587, partial [Cladochytrium tenue]
MDSEHDTDYSHLSIAIVDPAMHLLLAARPFLNDVVLAPGWLTVLHNGFKCLAGLVREFNHDEDGVDCESYKMKGYPDLVFNFWKANFETLFSGKTKALMEKSSSFKKKDSVPSKLYETLALQVFDIFPALCSTVPSDLPDCVDFLIPQLLPLLKVDPDSPQNDTKGTALQALNERGQHSLESCISAFLSIADGDAIRSYFFSLVKGVLQIQTDISPKSNEDAMDEDSVAQVTALKRLRMYTMHDLMNVMASYLPEVKARAANDGVEFPSDSPLNLFYSLLTGQLRDEDPTLQKKTYKGLVLLLSILPPGQVPLRQLMEQVIDPEVLVRVSPGAKRQRLRLIQAIVEAANFNLNESPGMDVGEDKQVTEAMILEFVPIALSEVIISTKESSERARSAAYECLIAMARQMLEMGVKLRRDKQTPGDLTLSTSDVIMAAEQEVSLREFVMMVVAGLAGNSSQMQSASIACLGRLIFEFHDCLDSRTLKELVSTVLMTLSAPNRDIVKSCLGFLKIAVIALPHELLEDDLEPIITTLFAEGNEHKSHFKSKIRHLVERLIRRFSLEAVQGFVPTADQRLITNIRKRRERAKKKKYASNEDSDVDENPRKAVEKVAKALHSRQKEFEDAIRDSESDIGSEDEDNDDSYIPRDLRAPSANSKSSASRIREDGDIVDFLDGKVISKVTSARPTGAGRAGAQAGSKKKGNEFSVANDGRLVIAEPEDSDGGRTGEAAPAATAGQPDYYMEAMTGEGAFERLPNGRIKFLKRPRGADDGGVDDDGEDNDAGGPRGIPAHQWGGRVGSHGIAQKGKGLDDAAKATMLGRQFRAK